MVTGIVLRRVTVSNHNHIQKLQFMSISSYYANRVQYCRFCFAYNIRYLYKTNTKNL